jgi:hypothetical protein
MSLPNATIGRIPDIANALPSLWNGTYEKIDANFVNLDTRAAARENELAAARGDQASLGARLDETDTQIQGLGPDMQNMIVGALMEVLASAGLANREIRKTLDQRIQTGDVLIANRGIIRGCVATKSTTATRNVNLTAGLAFAGGQILPVGAEANGAAVPSFPWPQGGTAPLPANKICWLYLGKEVGGGWNMSCTGLGEAVPDGGIPLYQVSVPPGSAEADSTSGYSDAQLQSVVLTDVRRLEPSGPVVLSSAPFIYVPLPYPMLGDYAVGLDVLDFDGGGFQLGYVYADDRQTNGFKICLSGSADSVRVRWTAIRTAQ